MQKCVAGDVLVSEKGDLRRRLATVSEIHCTSCQRLVTQGRYYCWFSPSFFIQLFSNQCPDCPDCSGDDQDWDLCMDCYRQGHSCRSPDTHRLYVYLRADVDRPHPDLATDGISCQACKKKIKQGPFYRKSLKEASQPYNHLTVLVCASCGNDSGICDRCYDMEKSCGDPIHVLTRYVVYKGEKSVAKQFTDKDCCQYCKDPLGAGVFYCKSALSFSELCHERVKTNGKQAVQSATKAVMTFAGNATWPGRAAKTARTTWSSARPRALGSSPKTTSRTSSRTVARTICGNT